jgi:hypothetical protein
MNEPTMPDQGMNPAEATTTMGGEAPQGKGQGQRQGQQSYSQMPYPYGYAAQPVYGQAPGMGQMYGQYAAPPPPPAQPSGLNQMVQDMTSSTPGLASLTKLIDFDDKDFWKGALVGAAAVLLLTNSGVQRALFRGAVKTRDAAEEGVEKVKEGVSKVKETVQKAASKENNDE